MWKLNKGWNKGNTCNKCKICKSVKCRKAKHVKTSDSVKKRKNGISKQVTQKQMYNVRNRGKWCKTLGTKRNQ